MIQHICANCETVLHSADGLGGTPIRCWKCHATVVRTMGDEDADWLGLSILSGAHLTLVPRVLQLLREAGLDHVGVLVGGIIPEGDIPKLLQMGVARVFGPGTALPDIVAFLQER